jgi:hypothetical protein
MDLKEVMRPVGEQLAVTRAYGPPVEAAGTTVIPVALVMGGGGGGGDAGTDQAGAGFGGVVYPMGVYSVRDGVVRFVPAFDLTALVVGALILTRFLMRRSRRGRNFGRAPAVARGRRSARPVAVTIERAAASRSH